MTCEESYDPSARFPSSRITPDQLLPDVGGVYRNRTTRKFVTLSEFVQGRLVYAEGKSTGTWMHWDQFWKTHIHAMARPEG